MFYYVFMGGLMAFVVIAFGVLAGLLFSEDSEWGFAAAIAGILIACVSFYSFFLDGQADISENKICHTCYSFYNKSESYCPKDGSELFFVNPLNEEETKAN